MKAVTALKSANLYVGIAYILVILTTAYTTYQVKRFLSSNVIEPLATLTGAAQKVGQGELNFPMPKAIGEDEIAVLTAFDAASGQTAHRYKTNCRSCRSPD